MKTRLQKLLEMIEVGLQDASNKQAFDAVVSEAQLLGVATKIEICGVCAMMAVAEHVGAKSPAIRPGVYRYLMKKTKRILSSM